MRLYIAEKPSMAGEIAKCLPGPCVRKNGFFETGAGIVTWAVGHMLRMAEPDEYDAKYKQWSATDLPIIPPFWKLIVSDSCAAQFDIVASLIHKATEIVHAGDPDREGQLLIDEILDHVGCNKPVLRLLLNALDEKSIRKALEDLRANGEFEKLKLSALGRQRADWLVGMNLSRAYTLAAQRVGHRMTFPVGRVKTPTLALVVRREREITKFKPLDYFTFRGEFEHVNGQFVASWRAYEEQRGLDPEGRLVDRVVAGELKKKLECGGTAVIRSFETKERKESQPLPYSLSALQITAGKKFGYSPQTVLDTAQSLYEKKLTTYPRSDCDFLPENLLDVAKTILTNLSECGNIDLSNWCVKSDYRIKSRAWNNEKITAHHAIIPTEVRCDMGNLSEIERNIYWLISQAYVVQFYPYHVYDQSVALLEYTDEIFRARGKVIKDLGWKAIFQADSDKESTDEEEGNVILPLMAKDDVTNFVGLKSTKKTTKPPDRFTEGSLLQAMKEIHKYVLNEDLKRQLKSIAGIGTEATRAGIISDLVKREFIIVDGKKLKPTEAAFALIDALPDELTYPDTTATWEDCLSAINTEQNLTSFLLEQCFFVKGLCEDSLEAVITNSTDNNHPCPKCGAGVLRIRKGANGSFWGCSNYGTGCTATYEDRQGKPDVSEYPCPLCKLGRLKSRQGAKGKFWGCTKYPDCKATYPDKKNKPDFLLNSKYKKEKKRG